MFRNVKVTSKIVLPYVAVVTGILGTLLFWYVARETANLERQLLGKATSVTSSLSEVAAQSVATREYSRLTDLLLKQAQADSDLLYITVIESSGRVLASTDAALLGRTSDEQVISSRVDLEAGLSQNRLAVNDHTYEVHAPITMFDLEMAQLRVGVSEANIHQRIRSTVTFTLAIGAGAAILGSLVFIGIIRKTVVIPLRRLSTASRRIADGDLEARVASTSRDELGELGVRFNDMASNLSLSHKALQEERDRLEERVAQRTLDLNQRNMDMRLVMDNVCQGFMTLDLAGVMSVERSAIVSQWFGEAPENATLVEYLDPINPEFATWLEMGLELITDGFLPLELCIEQLPARLQCDERTFTLEFSPILDSEGELQRLLVVISDITAAIERTRIEEQQHEMVQVFECLMRDKSGFLEFFTEADAIVQDIRAEAYADGAALKRQIHTLKGNAAIFDMNIIASFCHEVESRMEEQGGGLTKKERGELIRHWDRLRTNLSMFLGDRQETRIELEDEQYEAILQAALRGESPEKLAEMILAWKLEPTARRLARIAEQARELGLRLGKGQLEVDVESNDLRLDPVRWSAFWAAFVHVVRNAVDHGLERPAERVASGKPAHGHIQLRTYLDGDQFVIESRDDGPGIDWDLIRAKALERGLPAESRLDLVEAIFDDGLSTAAVLSEFSGRGMGMSAVRRASLELGGEILVESRPAQGALFQFRFPASSMASTPQLRALKRSA